MGAVLGVWFVSMLTNLLGAEPKELASWFSVIKQLFLALGAIVAFLYAIWIWIKEKRKTKKR